MFYYIKYKNLDLGRQFILLSTYFGVERYEPYCQETEGLKLRKVAMYLCQRIADATLDEIACHFGLNPPGWCQLCFTPGQTNAGREQEFG